MLVPGSVFCSGEAHAQNSLNPNKAEFNQYYYQCQFCFCCMLGQDLTMKSSNFLSVLLP